MLGAKKTKANPNRGFVDDTRSVPSESRKTAQQKAVMLDLMLGQIANFCPVIARNCIVRNSTSLNDIWSTIRLHYGFQSTGAHFLDFSDIKFEADERPEDLYQRILAFVEDNLLTSGGGISHHPTPHQLKQVVSRYFYALDLDAVIQQVTLGCQLSFSPERSPCCDSPVHKRSTMCGRCILCGRCHKARSTAHIRRQGDCHSIYLEHSVPR